MRRIWRFTSILVLIVIFLLVMSVFDGVPRSPTLICCVSNLSTTLALQIWSFAGVVSASSTSEVSSSSASLRSYRLHLLWLNLATYRKLWKFIGYRLEFLVFYKLENDFASYYTILQLIRIIQQLYIICFRVLLHEYYISNFHSTRIYQQTITFSMLVLY